MEAADLLVLLDGRQFRRLRVIENLLREKKTVSTLYWGERYRLLYLVGLAKKLPRGALDAPAQALQQRGLVTTGETPDQVRLTPAGVTAQRDATYYHPQTAATWDQLNLMAARERLLLAVQVVSQYAHSTKRYYPLTTTLETRQAVRRWFYRVKQPDLDEQMFTSLKSSLAQLPAPVAEVVVTLFTGYQQPGQTADQLAQERQCTPWEILLMQLDGLMQVALAARDTAQPLTSLLQPLWQSPVTRSAQQTLAAVGQGRSLEQIAAARGIKTSTAREHLLEAAILLPLQQFPYDGILTPTIRQDLAAALTGPIDDWQYTALPEALQARYAFFYFRLYAIWSDKRGEVDA